MSAVATGAGTITADEFLALEQKVLRAVTMIREEREARAAAEAETVSAKAELATAQNEINDLQVKLAAATAAQTEVDTLTRERESVRQRVEKMLAQMDELL